jgi:hypothetical protein
LPKVGSGSTILSIALEISPIKRRSSFSKDHASRMRQVIVRYLDNLFKTPNVIAQARILCGSAAQRHVNLGEVVIEREFDY